MCLSLKKIIDFSGIIFGVSGVLTHTNDFTTGYGLSEVFSNPWE